MQIPKPSQADRDRFLALVPDDPRVTVKPMFGQLAAFVNGNMFFGLFGSSLGVRLAPDGLERLRDAGGTPFGPPERPMNGYATLPPGTTTHWIDEALDYVAGLPPKAPKR